MIKSVATVMTIAVMGISAQAADIVGKINGVDVAKSEIEQVLKMVDPSGKTSWDKLDKAKKEEMLKMLAPTKIMAIKAQKELSAEEKEAALAGFWMQKELQKTQVTDDEIKQAYETVKASYIKRMGGDGNKTAMQFPPLQMLKPQLEMKLKQDKIIESLMKDAKVELK